MTTSYLTLTVSTKPLSSPSLNTFSSSSLSLFACFLQHYSEGLWLCDSSFFALLILFVDRPALQGGWVCFQFSPLPCPEKQHFQNQTNKTPAKKFNFFPPVADHSFPLNIPLHLYVYIILKLLQWYQSVTASLNPEQTQASHKPTKPDHLLVATAHSEDSDQQLDSKNQSGQKCVNICS